MDFSQFFSKTKTPPENKNSWGGTGSLPSLGKEPAHPAFPKARIPQNLPKVPEPSLEALKAAKAILQK